MRASVALPSSSDAAAEWISRAAALVERQRWWIVGGCVTAQLVVTAVFALLAINHNGWIYQSGDDGPWYWTTAWTVKSLHVPQTAIGFAWPYTLTPLAAIFGANMANGLPALILLNIVILAPAAVVGMYLLSERIAGRLFGVWATVLFTVAPLLSVALYDGKHRPLLLDTFLPTGMGLNALSDYPSMVLAIISAYLILRTLDSGRWIDGVVLGLALGFLALMKPANGPLILVALIVMLLARRFSAFAATAAAMIPAFIALTLWKRIGGGAIQAVTPNNPSESGSGSGTPSAAVAASHRYLNLDWHHLNQNVHALGDVFWSVRLLEFLLVAGSIGLIARARLRGVFVVGWFVAFLLVKGTVSYSSVFDTSFYRFLLPAWPAWILIVGGVVFCWPLGPTRRARQRQADSSRPVPVRPAPQLIGVVALLFAVAPLAVAAAVSPIGKNTVAQMNYTGAPVAIVDFGLRAQRTGPHTVHLAWRDVHTRRAQGWYQIFKGHTDGCTYPSAGAPDCLFRMQLVYSTRHNGFDDDEASGSFIYRVALAAGGRIDSNTSSYLLLSESASPR